jgi:murein L,D-transpeptidase YcbB/YkuD
VLLTIAELKEKIQTIADQNSVDPSIIDEMKDAKSTPTYELSNAEVTSASRQMTTLNADRSRTDAKKETASAVMNAEAKNVKMKSVEMIVVESASAEIQTSDPANKLSVVSMSVASLSYKSNASRPRIDWTTG